MDKKKIKNTIFSKQISSPINETQTKFKQSTNFMTKIKCFFLTFVLMWKNHKRKIEKENAKICSEFHIFIFYI